jgi:hypothetical protein
MKNAMIAAVVAAVVAAASGTAATIVVTSKNIKNGTIQTVDLNAKAKRALRGNRGPRGAAGRPGQQGPQGTAGAPGPSAGFYKKVDTGFPLPHGQFVTVAQLQLGPGEYLAWAKLAVGNSGTGAGLAYCRLHTDGYDQTQTNGHDSTGTTVPPPSGPPSPSDEVEALSLNVRLRHDSEGTLMLHCANFTPASSNSSLIAGNVVLSAIKLGSVTTQ